MPRLDKSFDLDSSEIEFEGEDRVLVIVLLESDLPISCVSHCHYTYIQNSLYAFDTFLTLLCRS